MRRRPAAGRFAPEDGPAGPGGGRADAAAVLRGLAALAAESGIALADETLLAAATRVGSDVAACLTGGIKLVEGAGEVVRPLAVQAPHWGVLLLKPGIGVPTARAYRLLDESRRQAGVAAHGADDATARLCDALARRDFGRACALAENDFQRVIEDAYPDVARSRRRVIASGAAT